MAEKIILPQPNLKSEVSVEEALLNRRSIRKYRNNSLTLEDVGQLLWAAQGINREERKYRTAPSAGALYPLEIYLLTGRVEGLLDAIYKYNPFDHTLELKEKGNYMADLAGAALGQQSVFQAAANIVICAVFERVTNRYGRRGVRYVHMEAGHAAQNIHIQASLRFGTVVVGAFDDAAVSHALSLPEEEKPLIIMPIGAID